jgi:hypothetical protein
VPAVPKGSFTGAESKKEKKKNFEPLPHHLYVAV